MSGRELVGAVLLGVAIGIVSTLVVEVLDPKRHAVRFAQMAQDKRARSTERAFQRLLDRGELEGVSEI